MLKNKKNLVIKDSDFVWNFFLIFAYLLIIKLIKNNNLLIKEPRKR